MHGTQLAKDLDISHLDPSHAAQLIADIKQYWTIFDEHRTFTPLHGYQCVIDTALFFWLFDAPTGYHQLAVSPESQEKLAFQGTDTFKWTYRVMPFGPTNGPATFIQMIHNLDSAWKDLTAWSGINVDANTNTNIIVDDIFNWDISFDSALQYMECQLQICTAYYLTLSLKKVVSSSNVSNL